jgi:hypothetical protein
MQDIGFDTDPPPPYSRYPQPSRDDRNRLDEDSDDDLR